MVNKLRNILIFFIISIILPPATSVGATVLLLKNDGILEGELLNPPDEINRKLYRIKTAEGLEISLNATLIERIQGREREALIEYNTTAPLTENTIENHLYWAKWCYEHQLPDQAKLHWQQILKINPDHTDARRILGYIEDSTGWVLQRDRQENRGLIQDQGRWKTRYQIEVANILENQKKEQLRWQKTVKDLCQKLPNGQAETELLAIRDPAAFIALSDTLIDEKNPQKRIILLRSLVRLPYNRALQFVTGWSVRPDEPSEEIRKICVEELQKQIKEYPEIRQIMIETYRDCLRSNVSLEIIRLAAKALGDVEGYEAIPELIDVLVITKKETYQEGSSGHSFGSGGSGINQGQRTISQTNTIQNQEVLTALRKLTGENFQFDQTAWRNWYRQPQRSPSFNLRRN